MSNVTVMKMERDHVSRDDLRSMVVGQSIEFVLPEPGKLESARSACNQMRLFQMQYSYEFHIASCSIVITRVK